MKLVLPGPIDTEIWDQPDNEPALFDIEKVPAADCAAGIADALEDDGFEYYVPARVPRRHRRQGDRGRQAPELRRLPARHGRVRAERRAPEAIAPPPRAGAARYGRLGPMASRRGRGAVSVILAIALGAAGAAATAGASGAVQPSPALGSFERRTHLRPPSATIRRLAASEIDTSAHVVAHAASLCWERDYTDPVGDAPLDAVAYRLTYDCQSATWRFTVTLAAPLNASTFDSLASEIDTDGDPSNGCDGFDVLVAGVFDDNGAPKGVLVATPGCDIRTWTPISAAGFSVTGTSLVAHVLGERTRLGTATRLERRGRAEVRDRRRR